MTIRWDLDSKLLCVVLASLSYRVARGLRHGVRLPSTVALLGCGLIGRWSAASMSMARDWDLVSYAWWGTLVGLFLTYRSLDSLRWRG